MKIGGKSAKPTENPDLASSSAPISHSPQLPVNEHSKKIIETSPFQSSNKTVEDREFLLLQEHHLIAAEKRFKFA